MSRSTWTPGRRPLALRTLDALLRAKERLGLPGPPLSAARVLRGAASGPSEAPAGAQDDVSTPLALLAHGFEHEAALSPVGRILADGLLRRTMAMRLAVQDAWRRDPDVARVEIEKPVFVVGLPRTGTSLLFNLLAQDPQARPLLGWEAYDPLPPPRQGAGRDAARIRRWRRVVRGVERVAPGYQAVHPLTADGPEEDIPLLLRSLVTWAWPLFAHLPSYEAWLWSQPVDTLEPTYRLHEMQLQLLQRQRAGGSWLLKSPAHMNALPALLRVYPDAFVVCTHRALTEVLPSACSLFAVSRSIFSDRVDPHALGRTALAEVGRTVSRATAVRAALPAGRVLDVRYEDLVRDPQTVLSRVLAHLGRSPSAAMEAGVAHHLERTRPDARPVHRYTLEQFGLRPEAVADFASAYHRQFDLA